MLNCRQKTFSEFRFPRNSWQLTTGFGLPHLENDIYFSMPALIKCKRRSFDCSGVDCWQSHRSCARVCRNTCTVYLQVQHESPVSAEAFVGLGVNDVERYALINFLLFRRYPVIIFSELQVVIELISLHLHSPS